METEIIVGEKNKTVTVIAPVKDSLHASMLSDRMDKLSYLKVRTRKYENQVVAISAFTITSLFKYDLLVNDLESFNLITPHTDEKN